MKKAFIILAALAFFLAPSAYAAELKLEQVMEGVCRVTTIDEDNFGNRGGARMGTGTVIGKQDNSYLIMTNGHVATRTGTKVWIEFFKDGYKSSPVKADVVWRYYSNGTSIDAALIKVSQASLGSFTPRVINLAPKSLVVKNDDKIYGAGFPAGRWLQAWQARVIRKNTNTVSFNMPPEGGQSGSAILKTIELNGEKYTRIVGMVTWRMGGSNRSYGAGVNLQRLYELFTGDAAKDQITNVFRNTNIEEIADHICKHCKYKRSNHFVVKYADGSYKKSSGKVEVFCPIHLKEYAAIYGRENCVAYNVAFPLSIRPPIGGGGLNPVPPAPLFPPSTTPPVDDECKKLKEKIVELESEIFKHKAMIDTLKQVVDMLEDDISKLEKDGTASADAISQLKKTKDDLRTTLSKEMLLHGENLVKLDTVKKTLTSTQDTLTSTEEDLKTEKSLKDKAMAKAEGLLNKINIPFFNKWGGLGTTLAALLAALSSGALISVVWHKFVYHRMVGRFGWLPTKILERIGKRKLSKYIGNNDEKNGDTGYNNSGPPNGIPKQKSLPRIGIDPFRFSLTSTSPDVAVDEEPIVAAPIVEPRMPEGTEPIRVPVDNSIVIKDINIDSSTTTTNNFYQHDDYAKQLFGQNHDTLKEWTVDQWVMRAGYYRDAIEAMKREELEYKVGVPLLNQVEIADVVEDWVSIRFMSKVHFSCINEIDSKYNKAYLGFLYSEAIQELRDDKFSVLGQVEAAAAIERYVRDKFMKVIYTRD